MLKSIENVKQENCLSEIYGDFKQEGNIFLRNSKLDIEKKYTKNMQLFQNILKYQCFQYFK